MNINTTFGESFKQFILMTIPTAKAVSDGSTIACRCPYCGDSKKSISSKHFYISVPTDTDPALYYCHLCHSAGIVTHKKLIDWGCYDDEMATKLYQHNQKVMGSSKYKQYSPGAKYTLVNRGIRNDEISLEKIAYFNNRLGVNLTPREILDLKIVMNLGDLLAQNRISKLTRNANIVDQLDRSFMGFLSFDSAFVTLRKYDDREVYKTIDKRYVNYRLFDKQDTSERFYVIPQKVDLLQPGRIKLHIAEGAFDILSVYLNMRHRESGIYSSVSGSNYAGIISHFSIEEMIPNLEVHLYPDNDQYGSDNNMNKIARDFNSLQIPMYVHRNMSPNEKDFGVTPDRIKESIRKINNWI